MLNFSTSLLRTAASLSLPLFRLMKPHRLIALSASFLLFACAIAPQKNLEQSHPIELAEFTTDGCSLFPDGTPAQPKLWCLCCVEHDKAYWAGGTETERRNADVLLKECVIAMGEPKTAEFMWLGVRMGGSAYWPTPFRWSYGWPYTRGYRALNLTELAAAQEKLQHYSQKKADFCAAPDAKN